MRALSFGQPSTVGINSVIHTQRGKMDALVLERTACGVSLCGVNLCEHWSRLAVDFFSVFGEWIGENWCQIPSSSPLHCIESNNAL